MLRILSFFKKLRIKRKKKEEGEKKGPPLPEGNKIAIFGHLNVGKTVYFVMLHEAAREDPYFRVDPKDDQTHSELLSNLRLLKGLEVSVVDGVRKEKNVERRFPPPTSETKFLNFVASLNQKKRFEFISLDYRGEIASIEEQPELKEDLIKFCLASDCILFFIEPQVIFSELYCRNQLASFKSMLELLVDQRKNLSIPVGLVVTKADLFDGFEGESQAVLINQPCEYAKSKRYTEFVQRLLDQSHIKRHERWKKDLRRVLGRLEDFFDTLSGLSLDFQVFFVSATGFRPPQKTDDKGETVFIPPRQLRPIGVKEPLKWAVSRALIQKRIRVFRTVTKWVFALALIWCLLFSIPNLLNVGFWYPDLAKVENDFKKSGYADEPSKLTEGEKEDFKKDYENYSDKLLVSSFFGMGGLEEFARQRVRQIDSGSPSKTQKEPADTAFKAEAEEYSELEHKFKELKTKIREGDNKYRLEEAPKNLSNLKTSLENSQLSSPTATSGMRKMIRKIDGYLDDWECWNSKKTFTINVEGIPQYYGLYVIIEGTKYGMMSWNSPQWKDLSWEKEQEVVYRLVDTRPPGRYIDKAISGRYGIADSVIEFTEINKTLKISKPGFDCKIPSL